MTVRNQTLFFPTQVHVALMMLYDSYQIYLLVCGPELNANNVSFVFPWSGSTEVNYSQITVLQLNDTAVPSVSAYHQLYNLEMSGHRES